MNAPIRDVDAERARVIDDYAAGAGFCRLLAGAFAEEPSRRYLAALRTPEALESLRSMGATFDADFLEAEADALHEALACEWAMLFAAPGGFPPAESVRLTGRTQQEPFHAVRAFYRAAGFQVVPGRFAIADDHLGVELIFVGTLMDRAGAALADGNDAAHVGALKDLKRFWVLHLGRWIRGYASLVERVAFHSLFREMARLLGAFAESEIEALGVRVEDVDGGREKVPLAEVAIQVDPDEPECNACVARSVERQAGVIPITVQR